MAQRIGEWRGEDDWKQCGGGESEEAEEKCNSRFRLFPFITLSSLSVKC